MQRLIRLISLELALVITWFITSLEYIIAWYPHGLKACTTASNNILAMAQVFRKFETIERFQQDEIPCSRLKAKMERSPQAGN